MHRKEQLSSTHEMYLKVVYRLAQQNEVPRVRDIAKGLGVSPGTVSAVLKKLERGGLVRHDRYGVVALTEDGNDVAECIVRRFETIKAVLIEVFGLDLEYAEVDACMMEHAVSPATVNRMERMVRLVRDGTIDLAPFDDDTNATRDGRCCQCEADGECQAEAKLQPQIPSDGESA